MELPSATTQPADHGAEVQKLKDGGGESGDVGERGRGKDRANAGRLRLSLNETGFTQQHARPGRGVDLDRQRGEGENGPHGEDHQAERGQLETVGASGR